MHIFLTGNIQVGKTTIIRSFLSQSGLNADGVMTYWEPDGDGCRSLYLSGYSMDSRPAERYLIARDLGKRVSFAENMVPVFDTQGVKILNESGKRGIIVLDELGFMESKAEAFQIAVMRRISGEIPILGVIKPLQTEFLYKIRAHPNVEVCEVTTENRDAVLTRLLSQNWR